MKVRVSVRVRVRVRWCSRTSRKARRAPSPRGGSAARAPGELVSKFRSESIVVGKWGCYLLS